MDDVNVGRPPDSWFKYHDECKERSEKSMKAWFVIDEQDDIVAADFDTEEECVEWIAKQPSPIYFAERNARVTPLLAQMET